MRYNFLKYFLLNININNYYKMKFIFVEAFDNIRNWNGYNGRYIKGVSGTHTSIINLAEGFVELGNEVQVVSYLNMIEELEYKGVKYINYNNFVEQSCDYIIMTNSLLDLKILDKIKSFKKIYIILHCIIVYMQFKYLLDGIDKNKVNILAPSEHTLRNITRLNPFLNEYKQIILNNSIDTEDILSIDIDNKVNKTTPMSFVYFPCIERGYKMLLEILNNYEQKNIKYILNTNSYHDENYSRMIEKDNIIKGKNSSKYHIYHILSNSRYFVYPLINFDNFRVHYDTFGYVILEALLHGVIVICPKMKIYEELFGDAICYIDTNGILSEEDLEERRQYPVPMFGYPLIEKYKEKIDLLENDKELRRNYIEKGLKLKDKFCKKIISKKLFNTINSENLEYQNHLQNHLRHISNYDCIHISHKNYLIHLKNSGFEPKVIYDIGSCVSHWTRFAKTLWPNAKYILFDAFAPAEFLYKEGGYDYNVGVLSNEDDKIVRFYQNDYLPSGNSYYREIGYDNGKYFPEDKYLELITKKIDTIVKDKGFPLPDFIKIDVQGSEIDIIKGGLEIIKYAERMIIKLQQVEYNQGALKTSESLPIIESLGWKCDAPLFQNNGPDGYYSFINLNISNKD